MNYALVCLSLLLLFGCDPFHENDVLRYEPELTEILYFMKDYKNAILDTDEDDRFSSQMRRLNIDYIIKKVDKQIQGYSGYVERNDSIVIFIRKSGSVFDTENALFTTSPKHQEILGINQ